MLGQCQHKGTSKAWFTPIPFLMLFAETHYTPFNMIPYKTCLHLSFFQPLHFWKGLGTFLKAKRCVFGSIDFNREAAEKHVVRFCRSLHFVIHPTNCPNKNASKMQNAEKMCQKRVCKNAKCTAKRTAETAKQTA